MTPLPNSNSNITEINILPKRTYIVTSTISHWERWKVVVFITNLFVFIN